QGSSTAKDHPNEIPVYFAQNFVLQTGGGVNTASGKANPSDYFFVIPTDKSGPGLGQMAANRAPLPKAVITYRPAENGEQKKELPQGNPGGLPVQPVLPDPHRGDRPPARRCPGRVLCQVERGARLGEGGLQLRRSRKDLIARSL